MIMHGKLFVFYVTSSQALIRPSLAVRIFTMVACELASNVKDDRDAGAVLTVVMHVKLRLEHGPTQTIGAGTRGISERRCKFFSSFLSFRVVVWSS